MNSEKIIIADKLAQVERDLSAQIATVARLNSEVEEKQEVLTEKDVAFSEIRYVFNSRFLSGICRVLLVNHRGALQIREAHVVCAP